MARSAASRPIARPSKIRRFWVWIVVLWILAPGSLLAAELLGEVSVTVDPLTRVVVSPRPIEGRWGLTVSTEVGAIMRSLQQNKHPTIEGWATYPQDRGGRIELRLREDVLGVRVLRPNAEQLILQFFDTPYPENPPGASGTSIESILGEPVAMPGYPELFGMLWPVGVESPVRPELPPLPTPRVIGSVPQSVRAAWDADPRLGEPVAQSSADVMAAGEALSKVEAQDEPTEAALSLARAYVWSRPGEDGEPFHPSWAAEAYSAALGLYPGAKWAPWVRGRMAELLLVDGRPAEAAIYARLALQGAPDHPEAPQWGVVEGWADLARNRREDALTRFSAAIERLPTVNDESRFMARIGVARALWEGGDPVRASRVLESVALEHPARSVDPLFVPLFVRVHLDAGRPASASPWVEKLAAQGERIDRERARWWRHEVALLEGDVDDAANALADLVRATPGSVLSPLARVRLSVLDAARREDRTSEDGSEIPPPWPTISLQLRRVALQFPRSPLEKEALLLVAQLWLENALMDDALELLHWLGRRSPGPDPLVDTLICRNAPKRIWQLLRSGRPLEAVALDQLHLSTVELARCRSQELEDSLVDAAAEAGLLGTAIDRVGVLLARGGTEQLVEERLLRLAALQRDAGRTKQAQETLEYLASRGVEPRFGPGLPPAVPTAPEQEQDARSQREQEARSDAAFHQALNALLADRRIPDGTDPEGAESPTIDPETKREDEERDPSDRPPASGSEPDQPEPARR